MLKYQNKCQLKIIVNSWVSLSPLFLQTTSIPIVQDQYKRKAFDPSKPLLISTNKTPITNTSKSIRNSTSQLSVFHCSLKKLTKITKNYWPTSTNFRYFEFYSLEQDVGRSQALGFITKSGQRKKIEEKGWINLKEILLLSWTLWEILWIRRFASTAYQAETPRTIQTKIILRKLKSLINYWLLNSCI